ncbi:MAG TPA: hypothetical protein P5238_10505 [Smithellaceae bacterium]|nr:hypothetical protein [Smithellaceae bacterium]HRV45519.1 hypothetical protein [Smithellaceae bacterium]
MPGKTEWIDLKREKRELDEFLSAIAGDEAVLPEENVFTSGEVLAQDKPEFASRMPEALGEAPSANDAAELSAAAESPLPEEPAESPDQALFAEAPRGQEEPAATAAEEEISVPLDRIETMARFEDTTQPTPPEKRKASLPASAPREEDGGILYWIKMIVAFFITMTLAVLAGYFGVYPERGAQVIDQIQSFLMGF